MRVDRVHVAVDGGKFVGVAAAWEFSLTIPGGELPAAGVTWVAGLLALACVALAGVHALLSGLG